MNPTDDLDHKTQDLEERDRFVSWLIDSETNGERAALDIIQGGAPDPAALDRWAEAMEAMRQAMAKRTLDAGWMRPTEQDVLDTRRLAQFVRDGAPRDAIVEAAWRVYRVTADPNALYAVAGVLLWLAGEADRSNPMEDGPPRLDDVQKRIDVALAFFERGGDVAGFVPTAEDVARLRRLREVATADSGADLLERHRLAKEMWARLPQDYVSAGIRRMTTR
jgi:hypothetical protein